MVLMLRPAVIVIFAVTIGLADAAEAPTQGTVGAVEPLQPGACQALDSSCGDQLLATKLHLQKSRPLEVEEEDMQASATPSQKMDDKGVEEMSRQSGMDESEENKAKGHGLGSLLQKMGDGVSAQKAREHFEASYARALELKECEAQQYENMAICAKNVAQIQIQAIDALPTVIKGMSVLTAFKESCEDITNVGILSHEAAVVLHGVVHGEKLSAKVPQLKATVAHGLETAQVAMDGAAHIADSVNAYARDSWVVAAVCPVSAEILGHVAKFFSGEQAAAHKRATEMCKIDNGKLGEAALMALDGESVSQEQLKLLRKEFAEVEECLKTEESFLKSYANFMVAECQKLLTSKCVGANLFDSTMKAAKRCITDFSKLATQCDATSLLMAHSENNIGEGSEEHAAADLEDDESMHRQGWIGSRRRGKITHIDWDRRRGWSPSPRVVR